MSNDRSLETVLQQVRAEHSGEPVRFSYYHRQFLEHLRHGGWVRSKDLAHAPKVRTHVLRHAWIERKESERAVLYRITESGLNELRKPRA